ncbi:MAG: M24 family metallopeptidase [Mycobacterium leprae]
MLQRLLKLRQAMAQAGLDGFLAWKPENRRYLSGFAGSHGALLVTGTDAYLITDNRYLEIARQGCPDFTCVLQEGSIEATVARLTAGVTHLGYEDDFLTVKGLATLQAAVTAPALTPAAGLVERLRLYKDATEVKSIRRALQITERAYDELLPVIRPGVKEADLAVELEYYMRRLGAERIKANFVLVSGPRAALPHGQATQRVLEQGDFVTFDIGAIVDGYYSDFTRTVVLGKASQEQRKVYQTVLDAQLRALDAIGPGKRGEELDRLARSIIGNAGYGDKFTHSLGHGVGLFIHEDPRLAPASPWVLEPGMIVTVEPGIYINGWGGVRIEDMVHITPGGCENLTTAPKVLLEL